MSEYRPIRVGDVVQWHDLDAEWLVIAILRNGTLIIEAEIEDGHGARTERRSVHQRDCRVVGQQMALGLEG